ncbi:hypothetical protein ACEN4P_00960 [Marinilactibacillus psychrotolerans]|uniref:hypothetical protein n=1 Tax=Marinilactibacillus psychrotolerans TaxID=191770 RepID=UPI0038875E67
MQNKWLVRTNSKEYEVNLSNYSSLFVNYTSDENSLINPIVEFFQPRSKVKDDYTILDYNSEFDEISTKKYISYKLSNDIIIDEMKLGAKSILAGQIKKNLLNDAEADGYINTINVLLEDLVTSSNSEIPIRAKSFTHQSIIKLLEMDIDFGIVGETNSVLYQNKQLLPILKDYILGVPTPPIVFFFYPENYLSPREQLTMKEMLNQFSEQIPIFVLTKTKIFLSGKCSGMNYFVNGKQLFTEEFIEALEWNSPIEFNSKELMNSVMHVLRKSIDQWELHPVLSNYQSADLVLFEPIDIYVFVELMRKAGFSFELRLDEEKLPKPVYQYVLDVYEKM